MSAARQPDRGGSRLQPLLHPQARRPRPEAAGQPVLAAGGADHLRARAAAEPAPRRISSRALGLDAGFLSRIVQDCSERQIVARKPSKADRRASELALTAKGRAAFAELDRRSRGEVAALLGRAGRGRAGRGRRRHDGDRTDARSRRRKRPPDSCCAAIAPATSAGWCRATARSMRRNMAGTSLRGAGRRNRGAVHQILRRLARALLDRRNRRRTGRLDLSGQGVRRGRQAAAAAGRARRRADLASGGR